VTDTPDKSPSELPAQTGKKPYKAPRLETYGDLRKITRTVANHGLADGGTPPQFKTR
jgi:hypothetical protein